MTESAYDVVEREHYVKPQCVPISSTAETTGAAKGVSGANVRRGEKGRLLPGSVLNPTGVQGRKPFALTDALSAHLPAEELAQIIAREVRKPKPDPAFVRLAAEYTQAKETVARIIQEKTAETEASGLSSDELRQQIARDEAELAALESGAAVAAEARD